MNPNPVTDPDAVQVSITGSDDPYCLLLEIGDLRLHMHALSAIDLSAKLNKAICDWFAFAAVISLTEMAAPVPEEDSGRIPYTPGEPGEEFEFELVDVGPTTRFHHFASDAAP